MFITEINFDAASKISYKLSGLLKGKAIKKGKIVQDIFPIPVTRNISSNNSFIFTMLNDNDRNKFLRRCKNEGYGFDIVVFYENNSFEDINAFYSRTSYKDSIKKIVDMIMS